MNAKIICFISLIVCAIIFPLITKLGYMFSIDQVINPDGIVPQIGSHNYWIALLSQIFLFLHIPMWILEKLLIILAFTLPGVGSYFLFKRHDVSYGLFFALLLSIMNPFLYARFLDGQINIYMTYALFLLPYIFG